MSVAIKNALGNLDKVIDKMEISLTAVAVKRPAKPSKPSEPDLFSAPGKGGSVVNFDRNALARQLDKTIARVEQLLGEA